MCLTTSRFEAPIVDDDIIMYASQVLLRPRGEGPHAERLELPSAVLTQGDTPRFVACQVAGASTGVSSAWAHVMSSHN